MRNNLKKKVCSLLVATLMTTATFANGFTYGGITVSAEESNVTVQNSGNVEISGEKTYSDINDHRLRCEHKRCGNIHSGNYIQVKQLRHQLMKRQA